MVLQPDDCAACDGSGLNRLGRCNVCKGTGKQPEGVEVNDDDTFVDTTDVEEIETPALPEGADEPDEGELDPDDDYTEGG